MNRTKECAVSVCVCARLFVHTCARMDNNGGGVCLHVGASKDKRKRIYVIEIGAFIFVPCILREHGGTRANPSRYRPFPQKSVRVRELRHADVFV